MKIGLFHGYELTGSGSNEYTRYLSRALARAGHEVHVLCREPTPDKIVHATGAFTYARDGTATELFAGRTVDGQSGACVIHQLPHDDVRPVFLTDKQRKGNVKSFCDLTDAELASYHALGVTVVTAVLKAHAMDVVHANHMVYQPAILHDACKATGTRFIVFPHGSSIEYVLYHDERYKKSSLEACLASDGLIIGNDEVRDRIMRIYPEHKEALLAKTLIVGVGTDTSLFMPVPRAEREASIAKLKAAGPFGGKPASLNVELFASLDAGDVEATAKYRTMYVNKLPDEDICAKLDAVPWDKPLFLFVGALTVGKGVQSLIAALPAVLAANPDVHVIIVGSGSYREVLESLVYAIASGNGPLLDVLVERGFDLDRSREKGAWKDVQHYLADEANRKTVLAAGESFSEHIHFVGRLNHDLLQFIFPCVDVAVFPSIIPEAYPLVMMESLANSVLPAVPDFSGFSSGLTDLERFLPKSVVENLKLPSEMDKRVAGIAAKLIQLSSDPSVKELGPELRKIAEENYDWNHRAEEITSAYAQLTQKKE